MELFLDVLERVRMIFARLLWLPTTGFALSIDGFSADSAKARELMLLKLGEC